MRRQIGFLAAAVLLAGRGADIAAAHAIKTKGAGGSDCVLSAPVPDAAVAAEPSAIKTKGAGADDRLTDPDKHWPPPCCSTARAPAAGSTESGSKTKSSGGPVTTPSTWTIPVCHV